MSPAAGEYRGNYLEPPTLSETPVRPGERRSQWPAMVGMVGGLYAPSHSPTVENLMIRQAFFRFLLTAAGLCAAAGGLTAHAAQSQGAAPPAPAQGQQAMQPVTDEQLVKFIDAAADVQNVQANYAERVQKADDQAKAQELRQEAQNKMIGAVEESGLTVQQFNRIGQRLQTDQALVERLRSMQGAQGG